MANGNQVDQQTIRFNAATWTTFIGGLVVHACVVFWFLHSLEMEKEKRFSVLETNQQALIRIVERLEDRVFRGNDK